MYTMFKKKLAKQNILTRESLVNLSNKNVYDFLLFFETHMPVSTSDFNSMVDKLQNDIKICNDTIMG